MKVLLIIISTLFLYSRANLSHSENKNVELEPTHNEYLKKERLRVDNKNNWEEYAKILAFNESRHNVFALNRYGYMGLYQFHTNTLQSLGYNNINPKNFKKKFNRELQNEALIKFTKANYAYLKDLIDMYEGTIINDVYMTKAGILAGAHLVGCGSARRILQSGGTISIADGNNVTFLDYAKKFQHIRYLNINEI